MSQLALLPESGVDATVAYHGAAPVSRMEFLRDVLAVAERLPDTGHILNLCKDRYWFAAALFASIVRGSLSVLPNSIAPEIVAGLRNDFPDLICLGDQSAAPVQMAYMRVQTCRDDRGPADLSVPRIPADRIAMLVYTSGSTGKPRHHAKTFGQMCTGAVAEAKRMWAAAGGSCTVLGTVPYQHMYGLESTVFLPLLGDGRLSSRQPFFPADVVAALAEIPAPRLLVTTPFHLRKLLETDIEYPAVAAIVSATAPMSVELAAQAEARLGAPVLEIYGSTETGQIATRLPTRNTEWATYEGIELKLQNGVAVVSGGPLPAPEILNDVIEPRGMHRFRLLGRQADMVNVAGKRSSLAYLNQVIAGIPGVVDGAFCVPEIHHRQDFTRLVAFVVAPGLDAQHIRASLLQTLDPVFLPRPIIFLDALPRDGNGKLSASAMASLIAMHLP